MRRKNKQRLLDLDIGASVTLKRGISKEVERREFEMG